MIKKIKNTEVNKMSAEILKEKEQNIEKLRKDLNSNKIPKLGIEI